MAVQITDQAISILAPNARSSYREAFANAQPVLDQFGISDSPLRMAHFMAQMLHECGGLTIQFENLNYSADRLPKVWPSRFQPTGPLNPNDYAHNPQKLANEVYGRRMGNTAPNDGFTYRGRGLLQLTGKDSYQEATRILRASFADAPDFVQAPDEVISAGWCVKVAAAEWQQKGCNEKADADSITQVTRAINGGQIGLAERKEWLRRTKAVWP
ncbi:MAG: glycoside hydrolase family 19 protein [Proteobacteria bacterium]|nr:glycoside hydrolase family 19 protein [Pseudomonadota bacterium]MBS0610367.1 glycoside hydrolase family 19 protein [Pseudomonadota bacterium]